jgi:hypothetical protein
VRRRRAPGRGRTRRKRPSGSTASGGMSSAGRYGLCRWWSLWRGGHTSPCKAGNYVPAAHPDSFIHGLGPWRSGLWTTGTWTKAEEMQPVVPPGGVRLACSASGWSCPCLPIPRSPRTGPPPTPIGGGRSSPGRRHGLLPPQSSLAQNSSYRPGGSP